MVTGSGSDKHIGERPHAGGVDAELLLSEAQFVEALGITKQALSAARRSNRVFAVECDGQFYYPAYFADRRFNRSDLERVARELGDLHGRVKLYWFTRPSLALKGLTPLQAIAAGEVDSVVGAAQGKREI